MDETMNDTTRPNRRRQTSWKDAVIFTVFMIGMVLMTWIVFG